MADQNYEERLISLLLQDASLIKEIRTAVPAEYLLSGQLRTIYEQIIDYYEFSDGAVPTEEILMELIEKKNPSGFELYRPLIDRIVEAAGPEEAKHVAFYAAEIENAWKSNQVQAKMLKAIEVLKDRKDVEAAIETLQNEMPVGKNAYVQGDISKDLTAHLAEIEFRAQHPEIYAGIPMGFPSLDSATYGHVRGELAVVVGGTGVGKSLFLGQVAVNVAKRGKNVLLVTIENNKHSYMNRIYSNISGVDAWKFKANQLDQSDKDRWLASMGNLRDPFNLNVVEFPLGCSARDVWYYMRTLDRPTDYLVVDQISNMTPNNVREHKPMTHLWFNQISLDLKRLAGYAYSNKGIPLLTAMQAGGGAVGVKELSVDQIAGAKAVLTHASLGLYITKDEDSQYHCGASKARDAYVKVFPVFPDFKYWRVSEEPMQVGPPQTAPNLEPSMQRVPRQEANLEPVEVRQMQHVPRLGEVPAPAAQAPEDEAF